MVIKGIESTDGPAVQGGYSQASLVEGAHRWLFISGQIPEGRDGSFPTGFDPQCRLAWRNIAAQLEAADMTLDNLVKTTTFLSDRRFREANSRIRNEVLGERSPALTVIVCDIYSEEWLLEIEAIAAD